MQTILMYGSELWISSRLVTKIYSRLCLQRNTVDRYKIMNAFERNQLNDCAQMQRLEVPWEENKYILTTEKLEKGEKLENGKKMPGKTKRDVAERLDTVK